ncbi:M23 family metallopeptidase [Sanguibacter antarcticus]|uniref:Murein DD-endopeptidase MepM/ murein hydrolase activator NlpD n=1 Tax=Sanguibacter antarcticus TaxID=372484 RepID=A0A2A9E678_9MICO|nr:M23 family metallopeptidase [Sanguibacter antarcticus]PFG33680.1 murein DD-endopeptidase MepM/ murein hydrolase activator NlpD [Sanguibacter antarcticus]
MTRLRSALGAVLALGLLGGLSILPASADDLDDRLAAAQSKQSANQAALDQTAADLSETDAQLAQAYIDLQTIEGQLPVAEATLLQANATLETAQREADALAVRLVDAEDEETTLTAEIETNTTAATDARNGVAEMARQAARGDMGLSGLEFMVGATSTDDFVSEYNMASTAMRTQSSSLDDLRQTEAVTKNSEVRLAAVKVAIADLKTQADAKVVEADAAAVAAADAKAEVERLIVEQAAKKKTIEDRKDAEQARADELADESALLTSDIQNIIGLQDTARAELAAEQERQRQAAADAAAAAAAANPGSSAPVAQPAPAPAAPSTGGKFLSYPTAVPVVTSSYGYRFHPVLLYTRLHAGTDFRAYCGTQVYAAAAGAVQWTKYRNGYGNQVLVNHGTVNGANLMTSYNHLTSFAVSPGQSVSKGQVVGYSGNTGVGTACHLHFEVYVNGATVNPMTML